MQQANGAINKFIWQCKGVDLNLCTCVSVCMWGICMGEHGCYMLKQLRSNFEYQSAELFEWSAEFLLYTYFFERAGNASADEYNFLFRYFHCTFSVLHQFPYIQQTFGVEALTFTNFLFIWTNKSQRNGSKFLFEA